MNLLFEIILFSILSLGLPIGKLFDMFVWNDRVTKTEIVFENQESESGGRTCCFIKQAKEIKKMLSVYLLNRPDFTLIQIITNYKNIQSLCIQNLKSNRVKALLIRRFHFNVLYLDDSECEFGLSL